MVELSLLCAALFLVAIAVLLGEEQRDRLAAAVALLEHEHERGLRVTGADVAAFLKGAGLWRVPDGLIRRAFEARYLFIGRDRIRRRKRGYVVAHVLGCCGGGCNVCSADGRTVLWTELARRAGRFDRWIEMARAHGDPRANG